VLLLLIHPVPAEASDPEPPVRVVADGYVLGFDEGPEVVDGRVMVSLRNLALFYGFALDYAAETGQVTIKSVDRTVAFTIGSTHAAARGEAASLDTAPFVRDGRILVPIRFAAEGLGLTVSWDEETRTVYLSGGKAPAPPVPALTAAEVTGVQFFVPTSLDSALFSEHFTSATPEGAALIERVVTAWGRAVPGAFVTDVRLRVPSPQIRLALADGAASVGFVPVWRGHSGRWNTEGFLEVRVKRGGVEERAVVYAPELAALLAEAAGPSREERFAF